MFIIEDEAHAEQHGEYPSFQAALSELTRLVEIPWDQPPNVAPCRNWKSCGRRYEVVEYDDSLTPWTMLRRTPVLNISAERIEWLMM